MIAFLFWTGIALLLAVLGCAAFGGITAWPIDGKLFKAVMIMTSVGAGLALGAGIVMACRASRTTISLETESLRFQPTNNVTMLVTNVRTMTAPELAADHMVLASDSFQRTMQELIVECLKSGWWSCQAGVSQVEMLQQFTNRVVKVLP